MIVTIVIFCVRPVIHTAFLITGTAFPALLRRVFNEESSRTQIFSVMDHFKYVRCFSHPCCLLNTTALLTRLWWSG